MRYEQKAELQDSNKARMYEEKKKIKCNEQKLYDNNYITQGQLNKLKKGKMSSEKIKTEEQLELEDLKNKEELINEILAICNANKDNDYCCTNQLKDSIENTFKMWGY